MSECRIYVASLADYNAGVLHGEWLDVTDPTALHAAIAAMLEESPTAKTEGRPAEEWAVHDYDGFDGVRLGESPDLYKLCLIAEGVEEHGDPFLAWVSRAPNDHTDSRDFEEVYRGEFDSLADYVEEFWTESDQLPEAPDGQWWHWANYIDWQSMGDDLQTNGEIWTADAPGGKLWVFDNR